MPVPVRDHGVQVFDDDGLAALFEHLREVTRTHFRALVRNILDAV
ncbi:MAG: hypothetical protein ABSD02_20605 [Steroidobacteraceae bacterium]